MVEHTAELSYNITQYRSYMTAINGHTNESCFEEYIILWENNTILMLLQRII